MSEEQAMQAGMLVVNILASIKCTANGIGKDSVVNDLLGLALALTAGYWTYQVLA